MLELKDYAHPSDKCDASSPHSVVLSNATLAWEMDEEKPSGKAMKNGGMKSLDKVKEGDVATKEYTTIATKEGTFLNTLFDVNLTVSR